MSKRINTRYFVFVDPQGEIVMETISKDAHESIGNIISATGVEYKTLLSSGYHLERFGVPGVEATPSEESQSNTFDPELG